VILSGRKLTGLGFWGQKENLLLSDVESVGFRNGAAFVKGQYKTIWLPLSLLELDQVQRAAIDSLLKDAAN
jgi:hypothetical protein